MFIEYFLCARHSLGPQNDRESSREAVTVIQARGDSGLGQSDYRGDGDMELHSGYSRGFKDLFSCGSQTQS